MCKVLADNFAINGATTFKAIPLLLCTLILLSLCVNITFQLKESSLSVVACFFLNFKNNANSSSKSKCYVHLIEEFNNNSCTIFMAVVSYIGYTASAYNWQGR